MVIFKKSSSTSKHFKNADSVRKLKQSFRFLLIFLLVAIGASFTFSNSNTYAANVQVKVMKLKPESVDVKVTSIGRLYPNKEVNILAEVSGMIVKYNFDVGDYVKKNQVLAKIDPTDYQFSLEDAKARLMAVEAQLLSSQKKYTRAKELAKKKILAKEKLEDSEFSFKANQASVESAKIAVKIAEQRLTKTNIKAPFSGLIGSRMIEIGQVVQPGNVLIFLVDLAKVRAKVHVVEEDYVHIDKQDPVKVTIEAYPGQTFPGIIDKIGIMADKKNATFPIDVVVKNSKFVLKPGFSARVVITSLNLSNVYFIPVDAVIYGSDGAGVLVVNPDNTVKRKTIRTGKAENNLIQVIEGLNSNDLVIVRGQNTVKPGDQVTTSE